jgi:hypothetical protein
MLLQVAVRDIGQLTDFEPFASNANSGMEGGRLGLASNANQRVKAAG